MPFQYPYLCRDLPALDGTISDYGQASLADLDRDGHSDFVIGRKSHPAVGPESILYWFQ
jgi:hypothetical protein